MESSGDQLASASFYVKGLGRLWVSFTGRFWLTHASSAVCWIIHEASTGCVCITIGFACFEICFIGVVGHALELTSTSALPSHCSVRLRNVLALRFGNSGCGGSCTTSGRGGCGGAASRCGRCEAAVFVTAVLSQTHTTSCKRTLLVGLLAKAARWASPISVAICRRDATVLFCALYESRARDVAATNRWALPFFCPRGTSSEARPSFWFEHE